MKATDPRMMLAVADAEGLNDALEAAVASYLNTARRANVRGLGIGVKWRDGQPTGEPALLVLVTQKLPKEALKAADLVPATLEGVQTDVVAIGEPFAGGAAPQEDSSELLTQRVRPAKGGFSVGRFQVLAGSGTIATMVYDTLPGTGLGIPPRYYILSNNHVLANVNNATLGDAIIQPGPTDGGLSTNINIIARLSRFVPIVLEPPVPREQHGNVVDAAIAEGEFQDLDREIYWIGHVEGFASPSVGLVVKKTGRTTNFSTGRIIAVNATVDVNYPGAGVGRFVGQIITTPMAGPGDSGSLVLTAVAPGQSVPNLAVGLLFAGSPMSTLLNPIDAVQGLLQVRLTP